METTGTEIHCLKYKNLPRIGRSLLLVPSSHQPVDRASLSGSYKLDHTLLFQLPSLTANGYDSAHISALAQCDVVPMRSRFSTRKCFVKHFSGQ